MEKSMTTQMMESFLFRIGKKELPLPCRKKIRAEYREIVARASDIGKHNILLSSYVLAAWFIAMNRKDRLSPDENCAILAQGLRSSRMFRMLLGDAEHYLDPKRIGKRKVWAESTHSLRYPNDWVVDLLPGNREFDLGYDYRQCGVCKLCRDEGCPELAKYLCRLDFMFAEIMGLRLERTTTLAEGGEKCDFRFSRIK